MCRTRQRQRGHVQPHGHVGYVRYASTEANDAIGPHMRVSLQGTSNRRTTHCSRPHTKTTLFNTQAQLREQRRGILPQHWTRRRCYLRPNRYRRFQREGSSWWSELILAVRGAVFASGQGFRARVAHQFSTRCLKRRVEWPQHGQRYLRWSVIHEHNHACTNNWVVRERNVFAAHRAILPHKINLSHCRANSARQSKVRCGIT